MSLHRFFVPPEHFHGSGVQFSAEQVHQLRSVLRLRLGDQVRVFDGQRPCDAVVELLTADEARVVGDAQQAGEPRTTVIAYPALLPRDKFELVLQKLTEVGVSAVVPVMTQRAVVREAPDEPRLKRWRAILREATEQSGRGRVPELQPAEPFAHAVARAPGRRLLAYAAEHTRLSLRAALEDEPASVSLFVGPEGDFDAVEVEQARRADARVVTLGPRILRAETASPIFAALVLYELEGRQRGS